jgi:hypothetical protein
MGQLGWLYTVVVVESMQQRSRYLPFAVCSAHTGMQQLAMDCFALPGLLCGVFCSLRMHAGQNDIVSN